MTDLQAFIISVIEERYNIIIDVIQFVDYERKLRFQGWVYYSKCFDRKLFVSPHRKTYWFACWESIINTIAIIYKNGRRY